MEMVLKHYGVLDRLKKSGRNLVGCCQIHQGSNPRQFSVNLEGNMFNCFGDCKSGGNVLDFVAKMEKVSIREAALLLKEWFSIEGKRPEQGQKAVVRTEKLVRKEKQARPGAVNPPLDLTSIFYQRVLNSRCLGSKVYRHGYDPFNGSPILKKTVCIKALYKYII